MAWIFVVSTFDNFIFGKRLEYKMSKPHQDEKKIRI